MSNIACDFPDCLDTSLVIQFKVIGPEQDIIYRIGKHDSINLFLRAYSHRSGLTLDNLWFVLRGRNIYEDDDLTAHQLGIVNDDAMHVVERRNGLMIRDTGIGTRPFPPEPPTLLGYPAEFVDIQLRYNPDDPRRQRRLARLTARAARPPIAKDHVPVANPVDGSPSGAAESASLGGRRSVTVSLSSDSSRSSSPEEPEEPAWKRVRLDELMEERTRRDLAEAKARDLEEVVADLRNQLQLKEFARLELQKEVIKQKRRAELAERELEGQ